MDELTDGRIDGKNMYIALAHPYHAGKPCSKFGLIPSSGLGCAEDAGLIPPSGLGGGSVRADGRTNGRTDGKNMYIALAHPYHAGKPCSKFGLIPSSGLGCAEEVGLHCSCTPLPRGEVMTQVWLNFVQRFRKPETAWRIDAKHPSHYKAFPTLLAWVMFEMNCLFLSGDFKFQVSPKVLIPCPRSTPRG